MNKFCIQLSTAIFCAILSTACSWLPRDNKSQESSASAIDQLRSKYNNYLSWSPEALTSLGWVHGCDGLLHTSLLVVGGGSAYEHLFLAKADDGQWFRTPAKNCLKKGLSRSDISRDMLLGLLQAIVMTKDVETIDALIRYADEHEWVMGESDGSLDGDNRVLLTPQFYSLMQIVSSYCHGKRMQLDNSTRLASDYDFNDHLKLLKIRIMGIMYGGITDYELSYLKSVAKKEPHNAAAMMLKHRYTDGIQDKAIQILMNEKWFPSDRLPSSKDRCDFYLWSHSEDKDWSGCDEDKLHPGHDFLWVAKDILDD